MNGCFGESELQVDSSLIKNLVDVELFSGDEEWLEVFEFSFERVCFIIFELESSEEELGKKVEMFEDFGNMSGGSFLLERFSKFIFDALWLSIFFNSLKQLN